MKSAKHKCLVPGCDNLTTTRLCGYHWFGMPLELRRRWWDETTYGRDPPSEDLIKAVVEYHASTIDGRPAP
jgi:hypothetical protein